MNKLTFTVSALLLSASAFGTTTLPEVSWANLFGGATTAGDQMTAISLGKENMVLWLNTGGSTEAAPTISYAGEPLFNGALYNAGNSYNNNLALICTDDSGNKKWFISSDSGDYASNQGSVVVDSEGNVIFTAKVRHTDGMTDVPMNLIDAAGNKFEFGGTVEKRYYQMVIAKADSEGLIQWVKLVDVSTAPAPAAAADAFTSDGFSSSALAVDNLDNIYIGGNFCSPMTFGETTLTPSNVDYWDGSTSVSCGNMFLVKLDKGGNYQTSVNAEGDNAGYSILQALDFKDGYMYLAGYARGNGALSFAGTSVTPSEVLSPVIGRLNADLSMDWLKCCPAEKVDGKSALQNVGITVCNNNLWLCGQYNEKITDSDSERFVAATQGSLREGFIIKFVKGTGEWLSSADSRVDFPNINKLTGYFKALQNPSNPEKVYVFGYAMDATIGVFLREYDADTLVADADNAWNIVTGGGVPSAGSIAYDAAQGVAFVTARGNKAFTLMGEPVVVTDNTQKWDVLMAGFKLPEGLLSGVETLNDVNEICRDNAVYDLYGRRVATDADNCSLAPGIYISKNKKFVVR